ncbi:FAD-dependent oxidoreductase [Acetobacterium bakii]|uniref:NADH:flavin oxidoreductase n=1 Tax=Acetobacterium bakii TaxID=52689 RepID=A0A0L6TVT3_9FIRM|nr:FAD-dependent oxidoreductase [Acetobacterium bakii]KNZ40361.1 NADH:flavin oxidoreductase [Acetobacterium bakii]
MKFSKLFSPIHIGNLEIKNRGVMPSMVTNFCNEDGSVSDRFIAYHEARAKGGVGLIIVEAAYVNPCGKGFINQIGIDRDELIPGLKKLTDQIHSHDTKIAIQIYHGGRQANTQVTGMPLVAPSAIACPVMQAIPHALVLEEIKYMVKDFADAAERAQKAGFDAVEIHGAHGYLLNEFLSPATNHRNDEYGGSIENRQRFPLEVVDAVRARVGDDFPVIYRITSDEFSPEGLTIFDTADFSKVLVEHGVSAINVSGGTYVSGRTASGAEDILGVYVENAGIIKEVINNAVPVIVANRIKTPKFADDVIGNRKADMVATGRTLICDADFYNKAKNHIDDEIRGCLSCNHCMSELMSGVPISCIYNPLTGHEQEYDLSVLSETPHSIMVVGGGPGGMAAAHIGALKGHCVTLYEQSGHLGGNVLPGTKPPNKSEMFALIDYYTTVLKKNGVDVKFNTKVDLDMIENEMPGMVIVATGSSPIIPKIPGVDNEYVLTAEDVLMSPEKAGNKVVVIGGGSVGIETAELLSHQDKDVSVIEMTNEILGDMAPMLKAGLMVRAAQTRMKVMTGEKVVEIKDHKVVTDQRIFEGIDTVVLAVGYEPDNALAAALKESKVPFIVIGDAVKPRKIFEAVKEGFETAYKL